LDDVIHEPPRSRSQRSTQRTHNSGRYRILKAQRVADGDRQLPDAYRLRVTQRDMTQPGRMNANDRKIAVRIVADEIGVRSESVCQRYANLVGVVYHVAIGQNEPVGCEYEPGSATGRVPRVRVGITGPRPDALPYLDVHHGRAHSLGSMNYGS
jgi:hypothetical protein